MKLFFDLEELSQKDGSNLTTPNDSYFEIWHALSCW